MTRPKILCALVALIALTPVAAIAQQSNDSGSATRAETPEPAQAFARTAAVAGMFEIEASRLALQRSQNKDILAFAEMMIADHEKADKELRATAGDMKLPTTLDAPHEAMLAALRDAGDRFDALYVEQQITAHKEAVTLFTAFSTEGPNGALRGLAAKLLPVLQHHQEMAGRLKA